MEEIIDDHGTLLVQLVFGLFCMGVGVLTGLFLAHLDQIGTTSSNKKKVD